MPSDVAVPLTISDPLPESGIVFVLTSTPAGVYWSRLIVLPVLASVCVPSPIRSTARLPGRNGTAAAEPASPAAPAAPTAAARIFTTRFVFVFIAMPLSHPPGGVVKRRPKFESGGYGAE